MDYSDSLSDEQKLDTVLEYLTKLNRQDYQGDGQIASGLNSINSVKEISEILIKLHADGYADTASKMATGTFMSTFDGRMFINNGGYTAKALKDANDALWKQSEIDRQRTLDTLLATNSTRLNGLTNRLVFGTWFAGAAALLLLLWQVWIWFYPIHRDYPYWFWETVKH